MKKLNTYTDQELLEAFTVGGIPLDQAMQWLYLESAARTEVISYVIGKNGSAEDAEDVFQDGIKQLILNVRAGKFRGDGSLQGYLFGMCRNFWHRRFQQMMRDKQYAGKVKQETVLLETPESLAMQEERSDNVGKLLGSLGEKCRKVLVLWKMNYSMREIAAELGYKSEGVARKKKHQCFQKLLTVIENEPKWKELIQ